MRSPQSLLFSRLDKPNSQPFIAAELLHPSDHRTIKLEETLKIIVVPPLESLQQVHVLPLGRTPELGAGGLSPEQSRILPFAAAHTNFDAMHASLPPVRHLKCVKILTHN